MLTLRAGRPTHAPRVRDEICDVFPDLKDQIKFNPDGTEFYLPDSASRNQDALQSILAEHDPNRPKEPTEEELQDEEYRNTLDEFKNRSPDDLKSVDVAPVVWALVNLG